MVIYPNVGPSCDRSNTCPGLRICLNLRKNLFPCPPPDLEFTKTTSGDPGSGSTTCHVLVSGNNICMMVIDLKHKLRYHLFKYYDIEIGGMVK